MEGKENLTDTILESSWFDSDCPMGFSFSLDSDEDKAQDEFSEKNCDDNYKKCWRKYFEILKNIKEGAKCPKKEN